METGKGAIMVIYYLDILFASFDEADFEKLGYERAMDIYELGETRVIDIVGSEFPNVFSIFDFHRNNIDGCLSISRPIAPEYCSPPQKQRCRCSLY